MGEFGRFYLDKEKDLVVDLELDGEDMLYTLRTPNHKSGNLIRNLASVCGLPLSRDESGLYVVKGNVPCYVDGENRMMYIFRLGDTKAATIWPDGRVEMKAGIPAIAKTLMSQTKDYHLDLRNTVVKTYIPAKWKFRTDLHTHMNANLAPDVLIALGIAHQIRYPLYYVKKLGLRIPEALREEVSLQRAEVAERYRDSTLTGKYLDRQIDDHTFLNFARFILSDPECSAENLPRIRASLSILKDSQAVFTNLEKVYLYRYVFAKGISVPSGERIAFGQAEASGIPDAEIAGALLRMLKDRKDPDYADNTLFQDKLLWIARGYASQGIRYTEISDTTLVKKDGAAGMLAQVHSVMPAIYRETGVRIRFLAAIRRIPLTIRKDRIEAGDYFSGNLQVLRAVASDPYVAGSDIVGEEINDIRDLAPVIRELVRICRDDPSFVLRIHAGENDALRENVLNSVRLVREALEPGQEMPRLRIGHGLYTPSLKTAKGKRMLRELRESKTVLEFQITSNVRLNNLSSLRAHPLKNYLKENILCVQGTDGAALYGTTPIDEQLALERFLGLTEDEMMRIAGTDHMLCERGNTDFEEKMERWRREAGSPEDVAEYYDRRICEEEKRGQFLFSGNGALMTQDVLGDCICDLPQSGTPVVVVGGSFNSDAHRTVIREDLAGILDELLEKGDPEKIFFVIGHRLNSYERLLLERNRGRFRIYAMVPAAVRQREAAKLRESGAGIRVAITSESMGIYKSIAYEVFKRRPSVLLAFDGNSTGENMIQEARNSKYPCMIFVNRHARTLREKASLLKGYVTLFGADTPVTEEILRFTENN